VIVTIFVLIRVMVELCSASIKADVLIYTLQLSLVVRLSRRWEQTVEVFELVSYSRVLVLSASFVSSPSDRYSHHNV
jgi:hypothetical protein